MGGPGGDCCWPRFGGLVKGCLFRWEWTLGGNGPASLRLYGNIVSLCAQVMTSGNGLQSVTCPLVQQYLRIIGRSLAIVRRHAHMYQKVTTAVVISKLTAVPIPSILTPDEVAAPNMLANHIAHAFDLVAVIVARDKMCLGLDYHPGGPYWGLSCRYIVGSCGHARWIRHGRLYEAAGRCETLLGGSRHLIYSCSIVVVGPW